MGSWHALISRVVSATLSRLLPEFWPEIQSGSIRFSANLKMVSDGRCLRNHDSFWNGSLESPSKRWLSSIYFPTCGFLRSYPHKTEPTENILAAKLKQHSSINPFSKHPSIDFLYFIRSIETGLHINQSINQSINIYLYSTLQQP